MARMFQVEARDFVEVRDPCSLRIAAIEWHCAQRQGRQVHTDAACAHDYLTLNAKWQMANEYNALAHTAESLTE